MKSYSISAAERMDAEMTPNATAFSNHIKIIAGGIRNPTERRAFIAGAINAAEQCGKHVDIVGSLCLAALTALP